MGDKIGRRKKKKFSVTSVFSVFYFLTTEDTECIDNSFTNRNIRNTLDDTLNRLLIASAGIGYNIG